MKEKKQAKNFYDIAAIVKYKNAAFRTPYLITDQGPDQMFQKKHANTITSMGEKEHDGDNDVVRGDSIYKKVTFDPKDFDKKSNRRATQFYGKKKASM